MTFPGQRKVRVDHVLRFESLENDWKGVAAKLQLREAIPRFNASSRSRTESDCRETYSIGARKVIEGVYREDIAMFGYSFHGCSTSSIT